MTQTALGLTTAQANHLLKKYGYNEIPSPPPPGFLRRFLNQFKSPLIYVLIGVLVFSLVLREPAEAFIVGLVLLINAFVGVWQEGKANHALLALKELDAPSSTVIRDSEEQTLAARFLVPGDILLLREGDRVPADGRLIDDGILTVNESLLSGESFPVVKSHNSHSQNYVAQGTLVLAGRAKILVEKTGTAGVLGKITQSLKLPHELPLVKKVKVLSHLILAAVLALSILLLISGFFQGQPWPILLATVAALAVSLIPSGLPVVMTIALARGVSRLARHQVIIKHMNAVEGLADIDVLAVDKTGTLTYGQLMVEQIITPHGQWRFFGVGLETTGEVRARENSPDSELHKLLLTTLLTNNASVGKCDGERCILGDPIEGAYLIVAKKLGLENAKIIADYERLSEIPFSPQTKKHLVTVKTKTGDLKSFLAGAPEVIIAECQKISDDSDFSPAEKKSWLTQQEELSGQGYRMLAYAQKNNQGGWEFLGLGALSDTLRPEAPDAIKTCLEAGLKVLMITGDHPLTALAMAKKAGLVQHRHQVITWDEWQQIPTEKKLTELPKFSVFARTRPENKLELVQLYQKQNLAVAMTGDGVNDAPALQAANVGIAMGQGSSAVARETGDIILVDNNFKNIVRGIEEARTIQQTLQRIFTYLIGTSLIEAALISFAMLANLSLMLLPIQILWINFITDTFLAIGLTNETRSRHLLKRIWQKSGSLFLTSKNWSRLLLLALSTSLALIILVFWLNQNPREINITIFFLALALSQWLVAWSLRSSHTSVFLNSFNKNYLLLCFFLIIFILQYLAIYFPPLAQSLHFSPIEFKYWLIALVVGLPAIAVDEIWKFWERKKTTTDLLTST